MTKKKIASVAQPAGVLQGSLARGLRELHGSFCEAVRKRSNLRQ